MPGPLEGIRVIDVSAVISGPLAAMVLADQGADVVKVEPPGLGDLTRAGPFLRGGLAALTIGANRGKRSLVVDLTKPEGLEVVRKLARGADVFIQNWRPGAADRLGLGESDLRASNPGLVYCSISGYGPTGPYSQRRVYDPIIQGLTGHVAVQKNPDVPIRDLVRNIVVDKASAFTAAQAITAALFAREKGGGGQHVVVPMLDASLAFFWCDGMIKHTLVGETSGGLPLYEMYRLWETADGHIVYFAATDSENFGLFRALGHPEWAEDPRFDSMSSRGKPENSLVLGGLLEAAIRERPTEELLERLIAEQVPAGPVLELEEIFDDPQVRHNDAVVERDHPTAGRLREARPAARFSGTPTVLRPPAPLHGEHTDEILAEIGYDAAGREALRAHDVIPRPAPEAVR